ncbi:MAG: VanZ family protein [Microbacterium sp.]
MTWLLVAYLVFLAWIVFSPASEASRVTGIVAELARALASVGLGETRTYAVLEFIANVALFLPYGLLARLRWPAVRLRTIAAIGLSTSVAIEVIQLLIPSRFASYYDVIANSIGMILGGLLGVAVSGAMPGAAARASGESP